VEIHRQMRASNGKASALTRTPDWTISQAVANVAARGDGARSIRLPEDVGSTCAPEGAAQRLVPGIVRGISRDQIPDQVGIGNSRNSTNAACSSLVALACRSRR